MSYEEFVKEYLRKGLLQKLNTDWSAIKKLMLRSEKDLKAARLNLSIDAGIAYTVAYLAMLRAARAYMLLKGLRPKDGFQHKTVIEFLEQAWQEEAKPLILRFDRMRRKRNIFTYETEAPITRTEAESGLKTAVEFVQLIKELLKKEDPEFKLKV
jgi:uncharacterized protein (UPF0332 family)